MCESVCDFSMYVVLCMSELARMFIVLLYVCMSVLAYVNVYVCMYVCMCVHVCEHIHDIRLCPQARARAIACARGYDLRDRVCMCAPVCASVSVCKTASMCACVYAYLFVCVCVCVHICIFVCA